MNTEPKVYILSPHIDDAAFGLTLTIEKLLNRNVTVTIINCFTVTRWTGVFVTRDIEVVSQLRKSEDAQYNRLFNSKINIINLDLLDAPLRNSYIFQNQPFQQNELELIEKLEKILEVNVAGGLLLCPLAIGNHIDHAICREAVIGLYKKQNVIFFEDLPYAQRIGEDQVRRHVADLEDQLGVKLTNVTSELANADIDKGKAIWVYKSQLNDEICSEIIGYLKTMGGERLWGETQELYEFETVLKE